MGSPCLFTRQQALKMGYFYWLCVKNSNHLHRELSLGYLKDTEFYLESKASYIHINSVASFKPFLIAWFWGYCKFSDSSVVLKACSPRFGQNTPSTELFSKRKSCSTIKLFFFFKHVIYQTVLRKYLKKKSEVTVLLSPQTAAKGGQRFDIAVGMKNLRGGDWDETQNGAHRGSSEHALEIKLVFGCFYVFYIANTEIHTWKECTNN